MPKVVRNLENRNFTLVADDYPLDLHFIIKYNPIKQLVDVRVLTYHRWFCHISLYKLSINCRTGAYGRSHGRTETLSHRDAKTHLKQRFFNF